MARADVTPETAVDTTASFQSIGGVHETNRRRYASLVIVPDEDDMFTLKLQTNDRDLQAELGSTSTYALPVTKAMLWGAVQDCRAAWVQAVNRYLTELRAPAHQVSLLRDLAEAGSKLFQFIFFPEDDAHSELRSVFRVFNKHLHESELWLRVESSAFFAPWNLLYSKEVPLTSGSDLDPSGFWGYQHLIEHVPYDAGSQRYEPNTRPGDPYRMSLQLDTNLDADFRVPVIEPVTTLLGGYNTAQLTQRPRPSRDELAQALRGGPRDDQFMYFCCHAEVDGFDAAVNLAPSWLNLSDRPDNRIKPNDITFWLFDQMLEDHPIVFLNACGGAQLNSTFYEGFAKVFLSRQAASVIGPQTEVPALFAGEFARCFLQEFFQGGPNNSLGLVLHRLCRRIWDDYCNPLGLVYSLYRGADVYLPEAIGPHP
ncbi:MAG: hypothetical protein ACLQDY_29370 [Streptosporangiaceae bacterium]